MAIIITLDVMMAKRKIRAKQLAKNINITEANLSLLRNGKMKGVKLDTLNSLCMALDCQPGDLLEFKHDSLYEFK